MKLSDMRHLLTVQRPSQNRDEGGGLIESWQDLSVNSKIWCSIEPATIRVENTTRQDETVIEYKITTRYRPDIKPGYRLFDETGLRAFRIQTLVNKGERNHLLEMTVRHYAEDSDLSPGE